MPKETSSSHQKSLPNLNQFIQALDEQELKAIRDSLEEFVANSTLKIHKRMLSVWDKHVQGETFLGAGAELRKVRLSIENFLIRYYAQKTDSNSELELQEKFNFIQILLQKNLSLYALKRLQKLEKEAKKFERFDILNQIQNVRDSLRSLLPQQSQKIHDYVVKDSDSQTLERNKQELLDLQKQISYFHSEFHFQDVIPDSTTYKKLSGKLNDFKKHKDIQTYQGKFLYYYLQAKVCKTLYQKEDQMKNIDLALELFKEKPQICELYKLKYIELMREKSLIQLQMGNRKASDSSKKALESFLKKNNFNTHFQNEILDKDMRFTFAEMQNQFRLLVKDDTGDRKKKKAIQEMKKCFLIIDETKTERSDYRFLKAFSYVLISIVMSQFPDKFTDFSVSRDILRMRLARSKHISEILSYMKQKKSL